MHAIFDGLRCPSSALRAPSPRKRGEESYRLCFRQSQAATRKTAGLRPASLLPVYGEKVPEGRMRGSADGGNNAHKARHASGPELRLALQGFLQQRLVFRPRHVDGTEALEVAGGELGVEQHEAAFPQPR